MAGTTSTRGIAAAVLHKITDEDAYANLALQAALAGSLLNGRERAFVTNLVYGCLRRLTPIDYQLDQFLQRPLRDRDRYLRTILRQGFFEILYSEASPHAVVNETVELAKKRGHAGWAKLTNGVLRNLLRQRDRLQWPNFDEPWQRAAFMQSVPAWIAAMWCRERGEAETTALLTALAEPPPVCLRVNTLRTTVDEAEAALAEVGLTVERGRWAPACLRVTGGGALTSSPLFARGEITIQEEAAQLPPFILAPQAPARLLDMCAAPGGKATYLAQLMRDCGEVWAADIYAHKLKLIADNVARLGFNNVRVIERDGVVWGEEKPAYFDGILLDAPCSGLGVLGRRPDSRLRKEASSIDALCQLQRRLLASAARALRPGGRLVYATCTISARENEGNRQWFLAQHPAFKPWPFDHLLPLTEDDRQQAAAGHWQLLTPRHGTDGFYLAAFTKEL